MHKDSKVGFVQITLQIPSRQRFAAYRDKGPVAKAVLVAGSPTEVRGATCMHACMHVRACMHACIYEHACMDVHATDSCALLHA